MLENVLRLDDVRGLARVRSRDVLSKTVSSGLTAEYLESGWKIDRKNKKTTRFVKPKPHGTLLEDRVWLLLYRTGFLHLSGAGGAKLTLNPKDPDSPVSQIDVVGIDHEVAIAIECKSAERFAKRPQFQDELAKHVQMRQRFAASVNAQFPDEHKRRVGFAMFLSKITLSENDRKRASEEKVALFDESDLEYYESLVEHLGPAAKYQILADLLPGQTIPGLAIRIPAIRSKIGPFNCFTFSIAPSYLMKIAYVSHRAKGKASDVDTYQRMIKKYRLNRIREFIEEDGIFPTNIVLALNKSPQFSQIEQEAEQNSGKMGWLDLRPTFKSAWIIDGQHRLFAYSGLPQADTSRLAVLAFDGLPPAKQAELFISINAQQKSVKQALLQELYADLHISADDPKLRVRAIISQAIQLLDGDHQSPFFDRIQASDDRRDALRCISITSLFQALEGPDLYISQSRRNGPLEYGPLWGGDAPDLTRDRTVRVLNHWFGDIRGQAEAWWNAGRGEDGGLAMNGPVAACIQVLRSVFAHLEAKGLRLVRLDEDELVESLVPYSRALASYLGSLTPDQRRDFRGLQGVAGRTIRARRCQQAIRDQIPEFKPPGLDEFIEISKAETNKSAKEIGDRIETLLQQTILEELRSEFGPGEDQWWLQGIPRGVRKSSTTKYEDDDGKRGGREFYFELIDYRSIIQENWQLFEHMFGYTAAGASKDKRTSWLVEVNEIRRIVAHPSSGVPVSIEQLGKLQHYEEWLVGHVNAS